MCVAVVARGVQGSVQQPGHRVLVVGGAAIGSPLGTRRTSLDPSRCHGGAGYPRGLVWGVRPELDAIRQAAQRLSLASSSLSSCTS